jgi:hypothetical protein
VTSADVGAPVVVIAELDTVADPGAVVVVELLVDAEEPLEAAIVAFDTKPAATASKASFNNIELPPLT